MAWHTLDRVDNERSACVFLLNCAEFRALIGLAELFMG
ncbi:hypothetical protein CEV32_3550 [Brucella rhizosphaerae]|uniref:Uncharacterized protein n=1 Tax=Brucella rhizosphaerae TaxID=571254 RepID=A0A256FST7_9HYPH|nr:hypothetical protein CEV32_3550 [Brucella rhizosphaerae]